MKTTAELQQIATQVRRDILRMTTNCPMRAFLDNAIFNLLSI